MGSTADIPTILEASPVRVVFGAGVIDCLGDEAASNGAHRVLLVTDPGVRRAGHADRAAASLRRNDIDVAIYDGTRENPTTEHVAAGVTFARGEAIDFIVAVGGGSAMDCAKGINLLLTNGGKIADYWGEDKPSAPMLPSILAPATAGTGSEAQSFALISDPVTHQKMACGDRREPGLGGLRPRVAILDPELTATQPTIVAAAAAIDAIAHAVETAGTRRRNDVSRTMSREAWQLLERSLLPALADQADVNARADMLLGAHLAGAAIEASMLGAAHACANPLTSRFGVMHGQAVGVMLPWVIRFNAQNGSNPYSDLSEDAGRLADRVGSLLAQAGLARCLSDLSVERALLPKLAESAAQQWTASFNPVEVGRDELLAIYESAYS